MIPAIFVSLAPETLALMSCRARKFLTSCLEFWRSVMVTVSQGSLFNISTAEDTFSWCYTLNAMNAPHLFILPLHKRQQTSGVNFLSTYFSIAFSILYVPCDLLSVFSWLHISFGMKVDLPVSLTNTLTSVHTWKNWKLYQRQKNRISFPLNLFSYYLSRYDW